MGTMATLAKIKALTFDCYGTLIDWESGILQALRPILAAHEVHLDDEPTLELYADIEAAIETAPYRPYRQVLAEVVRIFGKRLGFVPTAEEVDRFSSSVTDWPAFPDTVVVLQQLRERYKLIIISNIDDDLFEDSTRRLEVTFDRVITAQQVQAYKPDLAVFDYALKEIGLPKDQIVHCAQSLYHDIAPAYALGLTTVWVNRRHDRPGSGATPKAAADPAFTVPNLKTLAALLLQR
jgi:2-haloacid dehalogenase